MRLSKQQGLLDNRSAWPLPSGLCCVAAHMVFADVTKTTAAQQWEHVSSGSMAAHTQGALLLGVASAPANALCTHRKA